MKRERLALSVVASLLVVTFLAGLGFAQGEAKVPATATGTEKQIIKGTIDFNERLGGYFIRGVEPAGELFIIVNQNERALKKLKVSGKTVTIEGRTTERAAEHFFIEKIDGKKYSAGKPSRTKAAPK